MQMVIMSLAEVVLLSMVNGFGSDATAAYGVGNQVLGYVQFPAMSIAIAASILGAQAIGAGHTEKLGSITRAGIMINFAITGSLLLLCYLFARPMIGMFTDHQRPRTSRCACCTSCCGARCCSAPRPSTSGVMRASGTVMIPVLLSISAILLVEVPTAWFLSQRIGLDGVWIAYPVTFIGDAAVADHVLPAGLAQAEDRAAR